MNAIFYGRGDSSRDVAVNKQTFKIQIDSIKFLDQEIVDKINKYVHEHPLLFEVQESFHSKTPTFIIQFKYLRNQISYKQLIEEVKHLIMSFN